MCFVRFFFKICSFFHTLNYIKDSIMTIGENIDLRYGITIKMVIEIRCGGRFCQRQALPHVEDFYYLCNQL